MARPALFSRPMTPAERMRRYRARKGRRYRGEPLMDLAGLSERSRSYADVLKRFAVPELLALLRAEQPLGLRTAAEIARRLRSAMRTGIPGIWHRHLDRHAFYRREIAPSDRSGPHAGHGKSGLQALRGLP